MRLCVSSVPHDRKSRAIEGDLLFATLHRGQQAALAQQSDATEAWWLMDTILTLMVRVAVWRSVPKG
jgi:hypothetical protein